jgi:hypothetical protein
MSTVHIIAIAAVLFWAAVMVFAVALCRAAARQDYMARSCPPARPRRRGEQG